MWHSPHSFSVGSWSRAEPAWPVGGGRQREEESCRAEHGDSHRWLFWSASGVGVSRLAVVAAGEEEERGARGRIVEPLRRAEQQPMVAGLNPVHGPALESGEAAFEQRDAAEPRRPGDPGEAVGRGAPAKRREMAFWSSARTLSAKQGAARNADRPSERVVRLQATSGGSSETATKELTVRPTGLPPWRAW